jgi:hypothetical protein
MLNFAQRMRRIMPGPLQRRADQLNAMLATGLLADPLGLALQWGSRQTFVRVQRALTYQRFAASLLVAHRVGLIEKLFDIPQSPAKLARNLRLRPRAVESLLRILESEGVAVERGEGYTLSAFGRLYLAKRSRFSVAPMLDLMAAQAAAFAEWPRALQTGEPPSNLNIFTPDGEYHAVLESVNSYLHFAGRDLLSRLDLPEIKDFIVGSMGVSFSAAVLARFPQAKVTYGCLEHLVAEVPALCERYNVDASSIAGMHAHGGDPAKDKWGGQSYDLVFLTKKMILQPRKKMGLKFAKKALQVLRPGGYAIFWETIHPDHGRSPLPIAMEAVLDLTAGPDGGVLTRSGIVKSLKDIGFERVEIVACLDGQTTFVVARKTAA